MVDILISNHNPLPPKKKGRPTNDTSCTHNRHCVPYVDQFCLNTQRHACCCGFLFLGLGLLWSHSKPELKIQQVLARLFLYSSVWELAASAIELVSCP